MTVGEAIRTIREGLGESQQAFSNRFSTTLLTVSRWERNLYTPMPDKLAALVSLARECGMTEAADVLSKESGVVFQMLGPKMVFHAWERFGQIAGRILEFHMEAKRGGFGADIPADLWQSLGRALELANAGKEDMRQLSAMVNRKP